MHDNVSRRRFLHASSVGLGGLVIAGCGGRTADVDTGDAARASARQGVRKTPDRRAHIGVQLYTVRQLAQSDMAGTLRALAGIGYREVELAGLHGHAPAAVRGMLDDAGVTAPSGHVSIEALRGEPDATISAAAVLGHRYLIVPWVQPPKTLDAWRSLAAEFNRFGAVCGERGIQFAYHNHDFEFAPLDGRLPYDVLLAECDPELVKMELDLFWAVKGGQDPAGYFERHPERFPLVHVKDMREPKGAQQMTEVGTGDIDFRAIFEHAERGGLVHYVVEHDNPANPMESARTSYENLVRILS